MFIALTLLYLFSQVVLFSFLAYQRLDGAWIVAASASSLIVYIAIGRTKYYRVGVYAFLLQLCAVIVMATDMNKGLLTNAITAPVWLGMIPLMSALILTVPETLLMLAVSASCYISIANHAPNSEIKSALVVQFANFLVASILVLVGSAMRARTERALEAERAKSAKAAQLASLGALAGRMAHELNSPLAAVALLAELEHERNLTLPDRSQDLAAWSQIQVLASNMAGAVSKIRTLTSKNAPVDDIVSSIEARHNL